MAKETGKYIEAVGRRKSAIARVRITPDSKTTFVVNGKVMTDVIKVKELEEIATEPLKQENAGTWKITIVVSGGGIASQAEAIRLGLARAIIDHDITLRGAMKKAGFLKRDPRVKERRKFGLKKARKAPQWSKR
ncbi:MAG: 30S ribosomal protein S9 [Candidatus Paceibacterota bacterium]|jgi:small subunit ribosomal protein S9